MAVCLSVGWNGNDDELRMQRSAHSSSWCAPSWSPPMRRERRALKQLLNHSQKFRSTHKLSYSKWTPIRTNDLPTECLTWIHRVIKFTIQNYSGSNISRFHSLRCKCLSSLSPRNSWGKIKVDLIPRPFSPKIASTIRRWKTGYI